MSDDDDDDSLDAARAQGLAFLAGMSEEERTAFTARMLANGVSNSEMPEDLQRVLYPTIEELADEGDIAPEAAAIKAFRRHGYRAEMQTMGEIGVMRAVRMQG